VPSLDLNAALAEQIVPADAFYVAKIPGFRAMRIAQSHTQITGGT
jgi:hypothetical protein